MSLVSRIKVISLVIFVVATTVTFLDQKPLVSTASAAERNIDASSRTFFGEGLVQIIITDSTASDDTTVETLLVDIDARSAHTKDSDSFVIHETSAGSGKFEFFLMHVNAVAVNPDDIDAINVDGVKGATGSGTNASPIITFGPAASLPDLRTDSNLYDDVDFHIIVPNNDLELSTKYERTIGTLALDRDSYGSNNLLFIHIKDQDGNLNPTLRDEFTVNHNSGPNYDLFTLDGGTIVQNVTFRETGENTGVFEGEYRLGTYIQANSESLVITLHEKSNYNHDLDSPENDSNYTDEVNFTIRDTDGRMTVNSDESSPASRPNMDPEFTTDKKEYSIGELIHLTINDTDANIMPTAIDTIQIGYFDDSKGAAKQQYFGTETGEDTGVFVMNFVVLTKEASGNDTGMQYILVNDNITKITLHYVDKHPSDYAEKIKKDESPEKDFTKEISIDTGDEKSIDTITIGDPSIQNEDSLALRVGNPLKISTALFNNNDELEPFVVIVEVRDGHGMTVYLGWQSGTLDQNGQIHVSTLWTPERPDNYEIRTFAISQFTKPLILSYLKSSVATVS